MFSKKLLLSILLTFIIIPTVSADVGPQDIARALKKNLKHPYLFFNESEKQDILSRIENDPEANDIFRRLTAEANRLMFTPIEEYAPAEQKHPRYWSDGKHGSYVNKCRRGAQTLAFVYQMTGDEKYAQKAFEFVDALCDLRSWAYRAHEFPIIYSRVWTWNVEDDQVCVHLRYQVRRYGVRTRNGV